MTKPGNTVPHGREGLFIGENGTYAWGEVSDEIARVLFERGVGKSPEATTFSSDELVKYFGSEVSVAAHRTVESCAYVWLFSQFVGNLLAGSNCVGVGSRSRALGWKPKHTKADLLASVKAEVEAALKQ